METPRASGALSLLLLVGLISGADKEKTVNRDSGERPFADTNTGDRRPSESSSPNASVLPDSSETRSGAVKSSRKTDNANQTPALKKIGDQGPEADVNNGADRGLRPQRETAKPSTSSTLPAQAARQSPGRGQNRRFRVTAYCDQGLTAAGIPSGVGQCAAPADIPFGSRIYVPELGTTFIVTDRTHKRFRHNTVDLFIPTRDRCLDFGRHYLDCVVYPPDEDYDYACSKLAKAVEHAKQRVRLPN